MPHDVVTPSESESAGLAGLKTPTALWQLIPSLTLLACFGLPHSVSIDGEVIRPFELPQHTEGKMFVAATCLWPYVFALATLVLTITLAVLRPSRIETWLLVLPVTFSAMLTMAWVLVLFSDTDGSRLAMASGAMVTPLAMFVVLRMFWLYQSGQTAWAAVWGQGFLWVLAVFSLRWFWWPPVDKMLPAGWISIGAAAGMVLASWTWPRARHDLVDNQCRSEVFQISIRQIAMAITAAAVGSAVWRYLAG